MIIDFPCLMTIYQTLYAGTIRFNVLLGATKPISEVTEEELEDACRDANILDFIKSLPEYVITSVFFFFGLWLIVVTVALRPMSVARVRSCQAVKSVCLVKLYIRPI
jgi:hypothetical protein